MTPPLTEDPTLTNAELDELLRDNHGEGDAYAVRYEIRALVKEIRHHRSRGLSREDVEALRWLVFMLGKHGHEPYAYESEECDRALAVLSRLCAAKEGV